MSEVGNPTHDAIHHASVDRLSVLQTHTSDSAVHQHHELSEVQQHGAETAVKKPNIFLRALLDLIAWLFPKHQFSIQPSATKIRSTKPHIAPATQVELTQRHVTYDSLVKGLIAKGYTLSQAEQAVDAFLAKLDDYMQLGLDFKQALEQLRQANEIRLKISENQRIQSENLLKAKTEERMKAENERMKAENERMKAEIAERQARYDRLISNGIDPTTADQQVYGKHTPNNHGKSNHKKF